MSQHHLDGRSLSTVLSVLTREWIPIAELGKVIRDHPWNCDGTLKDDMRMTLTHFLHQAKFAGVEVSNNPLTKSARLTREGYDSHRARKAREAYSIALNEGSSGRGRRTQRTSAAPQVQGPAADPSLRSAAAADANFDLRQQIPTAPIATPAPAAPSAPPVPVRAPAPRAEQAAAAAAPALATSLRHLPVRLNIKSMEPKNREQREYLEALCDAKIKTVVCTGVAGTGKTVLAAVEALRWLNASLRSPREDDEEWCILLTRPRASDEDLDDLARPMTDAIKKWTTPAHEWRSLLEKDKHGHRLIQRTPFTKLRGVTLDNTFVILDEVRKWRARISRPIRLRTHAVRAVYPSSSCAHSSPLPAPFCRVYPASGSERDLP